VQCYTDAGCNNLNCCYGYAANNGCVTAVATCNAGRFACDKSADCAGGEACCLSGALPDTSACPATANPATGSLCRPRADGGCATNETELCASGDPCAGGKACRALNATFVGSSSYVRKLGACL